jgi:hypothetical protein
MKLALVFSLALTLAACSSATTLTESDPPPDAPACSDFFGAPCDLPDAGSVGFAPCCTLRCTPHGLWLDADGGASPGQGGIPRFN